jgi:hypothetical protein
MNVARSLRGSLKMGCHMTEKYWLWIFCVGTETYTNCLKKLQSYWHLPILELSDEILPPTLFHCSQDAACRTLPYLERAHKLLSVCIMWISSFDTNESSWECVFKMETIYWIVLSQNYIPQICPHERWVCGGRRTLILRRWYLCQYALCLLSCSADIWSFSLFLWLWDARRSHCLVHGNREMSEHFIIII